MNDQSSLRKVSSLPVLPNGFRVRYVDVLTSRHDLQGSLQREDDIHRGRLVALITIYTYIYL